jgi:hypothetical protein
LKKLYVVELFQNPMSLEGCSQGSKRALTSA